MMMKSILFFVGLLFTVVMPASAQSTSKGWWALTNNDDSAAIEAFNTAIANDPKDLRAHLGLMYAYDLRIDEQRSFQALKGAMQAAQDPHPYLYASILQRRFSANLYSKASGLEDILVNVANNPDPTGTLAAMACEQLGGIAEQRADLSAARSWFDRLGAVMTWRVIGPFHNISASGHDRVFQPETEDVPTATYEGESGRAVWWFTPPRHRTDKWVDFANFYPTVNGVFYAVTYVRSAQQQRVQLRLGTSGAYKLFVNNVQVSENIEEANNDLDTYITEVDLQQGWNRILVKVDNSELSRCNFLLRITNEAGVPIKGLEYSSEKQTINSGDPKPQAVANPFIAYFRSKIEAAPNDLENYLLLIEAHLRNEQVIEARRVLKKALKLAPDCIATLMLSTEVDSRGRRFDHIVSTTEHIVTLRPDLPVSIVYAFQREMNAERIDEAEAMLPKIEAALPNTTDYFDAAISVARQRDRPQQVDELQARAFERFPRNFTYASSAIITKLRTTGSFDEALKIVDQYLANSYTETGLLVKAGLLGEAGRYAESEKVYQLLFELQPCAPGYHSRMANDFEERKDLRRALASIEEALRDAPSVGSLWQTAGTYRRSLGDTNGARQAFEKALLLDPSNFDAREALREIAGRPSPFTVLPTLNIDSLIANAPSAADYPNDDAVILANDQRRVVYDGSRCEVQYEFLIRVLTTNGIDRYKEFSIPGGGRGTLNVEKAVVRKPNGRELPADLSGSFAVFKSLEPGDFIYVKAKSRETGGGRLSKYFTDEFLYNDDIPVLHARYVLLTPKGTVFNYRVSNSPMEMQFKETPLGEMYVWEDRNMPAIKYEEGMPGLDAVGKVLQVSSIPRWADIVEWYYDIARTKTRSTDEIKEIVDSLLPPTQTYSAMDVVSSVYRYITKDIRYSAVPFRQSGIVPQKACDVLITRIGDCKDVATLCIAMLAERNIPAYHVLVQTRTDGVTRDLLPSIPFDHAVVLVDLETGPLFLDLTADNVPVGSMPFGDLDAFSMVIKPGFLIPSRIQRNLFTPNNVYVETKISLKEDLSATVEQTLKHTGARTQFYRSAWKDLGREDLERSLVEGLSTDLPEVKLQNVEMDGLDTLTPEFKITITYDVPNYVMEAANLQIVRVPWYDPYEPEAGLGYDKRVYPYEFTNTIDTIDEKITITVPAGYDALGIKGSETMENPAAIVTRSFSQDRGVLNIARKAIYRRNVIYPHEYQDYRTFYNNVVRSDRQSVLFAPKGTVVKAPSVKPTKRSSKK